MSLLATDADDLPKLSPNHPTRNIYLFGTNACFLFFARGMYHLCSNSAAEFKHNEASHETISWEAKLHHSMRLLNMAWAIAEDGGHLEKVKSSEQSTQLRIVRSHSLNPDKEEYYSTPDIESVRDLYPRRVSEIVDLSKVFSAACMVLKIRITPDPKRGLLAQNINQVLDTLHAINQPDLTLKALLARQQRYNSHLSNFIEQSRQILQRHLNEALAQDDSSPNMKEHRNRLVKELFHIFIG